MRRFEQTAALLPDVDDVHVKWDRRFLLFISLLFLWRVLFLSMVPLDLAPDEAYYWDWSRHLDWGYYSKPPMVAWVIALFTRLFGATPFGVRLPAAIFSTAALLAAFGLSRRLYGSKVGFWTVLALAAAPGSCALSLLMTIDAPLVCFWSVALYALWRALEDGADRNIWRGLTILTIGLGLLSKQTMVAVFPLFFLFLLLSRRDKAFLSRKWPYALLILPNLALAPVLWWNARHHWITFSHTSHHFSGVQKGISLSFSDLLTFLGTQMGVFSPLTWLLLAVGSAVFAFKIRQSRREEQYLLVFSAAPLAGILFLSLLQGVNANWPAPFYTAGFILLAAWGVNRLSSDSWFDKWRFLFKPGLGVGAALTLLIYFLPLVLPLTPLGGGRLDATARLRGWSELGRKVGDALQALPDREKVFLLGVKRQVVSELAFYAPGQPRVYCWPSSDGRVKSQYDIWKGLSHKAGWDGLIVVEAGRRLPQDVRDGFEKVEALKEIAVSLGKGGDRRFTLYRGRSLKRPPL